jgi:nucleoside-diphosphate-sugar epimerase
MFHRLPESFARCNLWAIRVSEGARIMAGRVFITGGSGFVGSAIIEELLGRGYAVNALVNRHDLPAADRVRLFRGGLFDASTLREGMQGCDAIIHLVAIIMERPSREITFERINLQGTRNVVDAARDTGVRRYVQMSALGARPAAVSQYHKTKFQAEEYLRASGLDWTIFRPSIIHGPGGEFMQMVAGWARMRKLPFLFMPYFGRGLFGTGGAGRLQPIYVKDVARAFVDALEGPRTICEIYPIAGPDVINWPQLHEISSRAIVGRKRLILPMPVWVAKLQTFLIPQAVLGFNRDQVTMSQEENTCDLSKFRQHFGWEPQPFEPTLQQYADQL